MSTDWVSLMGELGREFAKGASRHDSDDSFVAENYAKLREVKAFSAGIPTELGGGGASHAELCGMVKELARQCGSTGLAFSMHTHLVGTMVATWRSGNKAPEGMLKRVAAESLILVSSGASDWLNGSGKLEKVEGGYRLTGRKIFASGSPSGDFLMTTGVYDDPQAGPTVIHFPLSFKTEGVKVLDNWRTLGMRGTGSHDVEITNAFLPDALMQGVRRPSGKWHPAMHTVVIVALPIVYAAYLGIAETARSLALEMAARRKDDPLVQVLAGELETLLVTAQAMHKSMLDFAATAKPGAEATASMLARRTAFVNAVLRLGDKALELAGGGAFFRAAGLERCFRDLQGARYHPLPEKTQARVTGRHVLGLELDI
jgi:alkylation response protein AidB-like acyl-CoA dehydrogenase